MADSLIQVALEQIRFARRYTLSLIEDIDDAQWFEMPNSSVTHVAWQVGHLAMAQYGLCLFRIRGRSDTDHELMSSGFRKRFMKGSQPRPDPADNPPPEEIRAVLAQVHQRALQELSERDDSQLQEKIDEPHAVFDTQLGALFFCSAHEMMHAGQIGLLRRLLGKPPLR